jgi:hypothetical protein
MVQAIQTSKFGTLDTSGRIPVYFTGAGEDANTPALNLGLSFTINGKNYTFIPEERISTGAATANDGRAFPGFLNPTLLSSLKNNSEYVDIAGTQFGSFDIGNYIAKQMGGSTKGYLATEDVVKPIIDAGVTLYNPAFAGRITGVGSAEGRPVYSVPNGYLTPEGKQTKTTSEIIGWRESGGLGGLGSFLASIDPSTAISRELTNIAQPVEKAITTAVSDVSKALSTDDAKKAMAVGAAFFVPGVGAAIGQSLVTAGVITGAAIPYAAAIGTALASTASQTAQGVPFEQALGNSVTSAVVSVGAPSVAQDINALVKSPAVADAITSAGASALKTAAAGGTAEDIQRNMTAALAGSSASSLYSQAAQEETFRTGRVIGSAVGGAVSGGVMGAAAGVAGELGRPETPPVRPPQLAEVDTGTVSDVPTLTETLVTAPREAPNVGDTSIISPDVSISPKDKAVMDAANIGKEPSLKEVTVTAKPESPPIEETSIIEPVSITDKPPEKDVSAEEEEPTAKEKDGYRPDLFIYGGKSPKTPGRQTVQLGTTLQPPFYPSSTLGQALTGYRGAGEIEGKKSGKPRRDVWNEESLRLKDALGL